MEITNLRVAKSRWCPNQYHCGVGVKRHLATIWLCTNTSQRLLSGSAADPSCICWCCCCSRKLFSPWTLGWHGRPKELSWVEVQQSERSKKRCRPEARRHLVLLWAWPWGKWTLEFGSKRLHWAEVWGRRSWSRSSRWPRATCKRGKGKSSDDYDDQRNNQQTCNDVPSSKCICCIYCSAKIWKR